MARPECISQSLQCLMDYVATAIGSIGHRLTFLLNVLNPAFALLPSSTKARMGTF